MNLELQNLNEDEYIRKLRWHGLLNNNNEDDDNDKLKETIELNLQRLEIKSRNSTDSL